MKRKFCAGLVITMLVMTGCASTPGDGESISGFSVESLEDVDGEPTSEDTTGTDSGSEPVSEISDAKNQKDDATTEASDSEYLGFTDSGIDFSHDYESEIKAEVNALPDSSGSIQEELAAVEEIYNRYVEQTKDVWAQQEMNFVASWYYTIWDTELNSIWSRISADEDLKNKLLPDQRIWNNNKSDVVIMFIGPEEEGGSMYPMLESGVLRRLTRDRCYILGKELASKKGESFTLPEKDLFGAYFDMMGTDEIYSSLKIDSTMENDNYAEISIHRLGTVEGEVTETGNGALSFVSYDGTTKGTITYGWDGATFEVTESSDGHFEVGENYIFSSVY